MTCLGFGSLLDVMIEVVLILVVITVVGQYAAMPIFIAGLIHQPWSTLYPFLLSFVTTCEQ